MTPDPVTVSFPEGQISLLDAYLRGLPSPATRAVYKQVLLQFQSFLGDKNLLQVTRREVEAYRSHMESMNRNPATISKSLSALCGFYSFALDEGSIERNPASSARRPKLSDVSPRIGTTVEEVRSLLAAIDATKPIGLRDRAIVLLLSIQGLRISEVLGLQIQDLGEEDGHKTAEITGKGGKNVRITLAAQVWQALIMLKEACHIEDGFIFVPITKAGIIQIGKSLSSQGAWKRIDHLARKAGIKRHLHPHLFRHGAITIALQSGVALHLTQDFARHADPRTTRRYDSHRASLNNPAPHVLSSAITGGQIPSSTQTDVGKTDEPQK
ncbi:MAG: tyrosine-type recombinase/integrase [Candidatus Omnitrophica bacterium]|nr:tyrosine-type recombinase/integrase [Candidatus Omnitrophota bacterium]